MRWASANSRFFSGTNSVNVRCPMPASGVSASEEVTLPAIPGNRSRDRNIHPRGRETIGDRRNYSVSALFLPVAHAVAQAIFFPFTPSISFRLLFPVAYLPFILLPSIFFFFHWHGRDTYTSPFRIPHMRRINPLISFYPSLSLSSYSPPPPFYTLSWIHRTPFLSMATFALSLLRRPSSSFPRICGQFGAAEPPMDREGTRHTAVPTVPSHFEKYPGKMIRPLLRSSLSLSLSLSFSLRIALPICPSLSLPLLPCLSFTGADCSSSPIPVPITAAVFSSPRSAHKRRAVARREDPFSFPETRCALNVIVLSCLHAVSSRGKLAMTIPAKRYSRVRYDSL